MIATAKKLFQTLLITLGLLISIKGFAQTEVSVGYMPILPVSQFFIVEKDEEIKAKGIKFNKTRFSDGPSMVQALASGKLDVVYFGIGPAMVAKAKGVDIKVVASNGNEQIALIGRGEFASYFGDDSTPKQAIEKFKQDFGRKPKIATFPTGSVPNTVLRYYLEKVVGVSTDEVEIVTMGISQVEQALLSRSVDAASILEPVLTLVLEKDKTAKILAKGGQMLPNQPGAVLAVRSDFIKDHSEVVQTLVDLHIKATNLINQNPTAAAQYIYDAIGRGLIPLEVIQKALVSGNAKYTANPNDIIESTQVMNNYQKEIGVIKQPVQLDTLFDTHFYDQSKNN